MALHTADPAGGTPDRGRGGILTEGGQVIKESGSHVPSRSAGLWLLILYTVDLRYEILREEGERETGYILCVLLPWLCSL